MNTQYRTRARTIRATDVSTQPRPTGRFTPSALPLAAGLVLLALLGSAPPAQAHNSLVSSTPAAGSTLTTMPERFSITTNEALLDISGDGTGFAMQLSDTGGLFYGDGCVAVEGATVSMRSALGEPGTYLVQWQIVSADGHPASDEFEFDWQPSEAATPSVGASTAPNCGGAATDGAGTESPASGEPDDAVDTEVTGASVSNPDLSEPLVVGGVLIAVAAGLVVMFAVLRRKKLP